MNNNADKLLLCPFCGSEQTMRRHNEHVLLTASNHKRGCIMRELLPFVAFSTEAEAIAAWNTRAEMSYLDALILLDELGLSERTCKVIEEQHNYYGYQTQVDDYTFSLSCGHTVTWDDLPDYCPYCGAKVVS